MQAFLKVLKTMCANVDTSRDYTEASRHAAGLSDGVKALGARIKAAVSDINDSVLNAKNNEDVLSIMKTQQWCQRVLADTWQSTEDAVRAIERTLVELHEVDQFVKEHSDPSTGES